MKALKGGWKKARVKETSTSSITLLDEITSDSELLIFADKVTTFKPTEVVTEIIDNTHKLDIFGDGSCIACYTFDGNANDLSGKYNGTWHGNEQYDVGRFGQAAKFDGSSYITIPEPLKSLPFSVSVWIKTTQKATGSTNWANPTIMGFATSGVSSNDFGIEVKNGYIHIFSGFGVEKYYTTSKFVSDNKWHLITVNFNTNKCEIYCDDEFVDSFSQNSTQIANVPKWYIGCMYNYDPHHIGIVSGSYYQGLIDQVRIFNRALTEEEVKFLYYKEGYKYKLTFDDIGTKITSIVVPARVTEINWKDVSYDSSTDTIKLVSDVYTRMGRSIQMKMEGSDNCEVLSTQINLWKVK